MEIRQKYERTKQHLKENKKTYIACVGTAVVAVVGTVLVLSDHDGEAKGIAKAIGWKPRAEYLETTINLVERSTPSRPVHLKGTNLYFSSISEAAKETGHSMSMISRQVNGHIPDVKGDVFEVLQPAST